jgi:signal transduction histidine kinase
MRDSNQNGGIRFLVDSVSRLPIHVHMLIYTISFFVPLYLIISIAIFEIQELDENSGRLSQLKLASFNVEGVQAATGKILILSDLIYASSESYLIDGAISLAKSTLASYRGIDFVGSVSDVEIQGYDQYLTSVMEGLTNLSYLDAIQLQNQLDQFVVEYDRNSEQLLASLIDLKASLDIKLETMSLQVSNDRNNFVIGSIASLFAWICYAFLIFRIHLNYLARPVQFLDRAAQSATSESDLITLPEQGPAEYRSLSQSLTAYDQQLAARRGLLKIISDISTHLTRIDKVLDSYDIVVETLKKGFGTNAIIWYEKDISRGYVNTQRQENARSDSMLPQVIPEEARCIDLLSAHIGTTLLSSADPILTDIFETKDAQNDPVVGLIGIHLAGELEAFVMIVNPQQQMEAIFNEQSLTQIGQVISTSIEKLALGEHLEERVRVRTEDLEREKVKAEAANIAKSSFLSTMTHEIRTPFNGIIGMADLLQQSDLDEQQSLFVKTILSSSRHLLDLLSSILDFSRLEAGGVELKLMRVNLLASFKDLMAIAIQKNINEDQEIRLETNLDADLHLECDEELIKQVVRGLIGNATQHSNAKHIVVNVQASALSSENTLLMVAVADDGLGINEQLHENLFEPFVQGETKVIAGTGLGLASFSRMVSLMGGELQVESAEGKGSRFFFELRLPVVESMAEEAVRIDLFIRSELYNHEQVIFLDDGSLDQSIFQLVQQLKFATEMVHVAGDEGVLLPIGKESRLIFVNVAMDAVKLRSFLDLLQSLDAKGEFSGSNTLVIGVGSSESGFENAFPGYGFFHGFLNAPVYAKELVEVITRSVINQPGSKRSG